MSPNQKPTNQKPSNKRTAYQPKSNSDDNDYQADLAPLFSWRVAATGLSFIVFGLLGCSTAASFLALSKAGISQIIIWACAIFALLWIALATIFGFRNLNGIYPTLLEALYQMRYIGCHVLIACLLHLCATRWPRCAAGFGIASLVIVLIGVGASAADAVGVDISIKYLIQKRRPKRPTEQIAKEFESDLCSSWSPIPGALN